MKQRQKLYGADVKNDYQHYSDSDENNVDSIPLLSVRNVCIDGERTSPSRRNNLTQPRFEQTNNHVNRVVQRPVLEAQVQETDTLQAIALRFHCSVEELKRLNNIHRENEIFAHSVLKIPITPHSILLGTLPKVHQSSGSNSPKATSPKNSIGNVLLNPQELNEKLLVAQPNGSNPLKAIESVELAQEVTVNDVIFNSTVVPNENSGNETINDFSANGDVKTLQNVLNLNGIDCGVKWYHLLIVMLLLAFIIPLIYVLYIAEHLEKYNHHSNFSGKKDH